MLLLMTQFTRQEHLAGRLQREGWVAVIQAQGECSERSER